MNGSTGLTSSDAAMRLAAAGPNEIQRQPGPGAWLLLARQFNSPVIWLLGAGCALSMALGESADAIAILAIVGVNGAIGFVQERRAERAIVALRAMTAPRARVRRDGQAAVVDAATVVPGDLLLLEPGDVIAADARLIEAHSLTTNEAALTGESAPVRKSIEASPDHAPLAERRNWVFMGTAVATGVGTADVAATGMRTELGRIAHLLETVAPTATPLQRRLAVVTRTLVYICLGVVAAVAAAGAVRGLPPLDVLLSAVSLAVAAVPEGLPAIVTIALAIGVQRMSARHVLIRRLPAVETLGCATVICTDKTGTLTTGTMAVRDVWGADEYAILRAAAACCDAEIQGMGPSGTGDPTELAVLTAAAAAGIRREVIEHATPRVDVHPFDPTRRWMAIRRSDGILYVKGAVEALLPRCMRGMEGALEAHAGLSTRGLRVLAVATGRGAELRDLELLGLIGIADAPRPEVIPAIAAARRAGIRIVMITGDHPVTARAIASELGILTAGERPDDVLHARATPQDKLDVVRQWKARGAIVAMTGDGVNDAPALREAHVGIAMGRTGTEVTREASDMILTDDNFASIIAAVHEGRGVYENIRKTLVYLLAGNTSELALMLAAAVAGYPLPLLPLQLLWINIVTDGLPALALVMDPTDADVLARPPRPPSEQMLGRAQWRSVIAIGVMEGGLILSLFAWLLLDRPVSDARDLAFTALVFAEVFRAFAARSGSRTLWSVGAFTNLRLITVAVLTVLAQFGLHQFAPSRDLFALHLMNPGEWLLALAVGLLPVTAIEVAKLLRAPWSAHSRGR